MIDDKLKNAESNEDDSELRDDELSDAEIASDDELSDAEIASDDELNDDEITSDDEFIEDVEEEFKKEIEYEKEGPAATDEELLLRMKKRIINSYRWHEDIIVPFSEELQISEGELEEILMKRLDMSSLEALHPRFESSKPRCTKERIHSDLKLCWLCDVMNLLTEDEAERIKDRITFEVLKEDKSYEDALQDGRRELLEYLKR